jgi:hypothetical protein
MQFGRNMWWRWYIHKSNYQLQTVKESLPYEMFLGSASKYPKK